MGIYGGLQPDDWRRWGQFTTFKSNAAELLGKQLRPNQVIYCSPLVDPYQPAEESTQLMPRIIEQVALHPPKIFVIQTRGPLILRDIAALRDISTRTALRVSFSLTTNREDVRRLYEPHCASFEERLDTIRALRAAGIRTFAALAPLLPCDPEELARLAMDATDHNIIGDPLHVRAVKRHGATTREAAYKISERHDFSAWLEPAFQAEVVERIELAAAKQGRRFGIGPEGFGWLAQ
jgi:DNA repair photolyase